MIPNLNLIEKLIWGAIFATAIAASAYSCSGCKQNSGKNSIYYYKDAA